MNLDEIIVILDRHLEWLEGKESGKRANLWGADLSGVDFNGANLSGAILSRANFSGAYFSGANLSDADLSRANLIGANLSGSKLIRADLSGAKLIDADLMGSELMRAKLSGVDLRGCIGNGKEIKTIQTQEWVITYTDTAMAIGCEQHLIVEWMGFDDEVISEMHEDALEFWEFWKRILTRIFDKDGVIYEIQ